MAAFSPAIPTAEEKSAFVLSGLDLMVEKNPYTNAIGTDTVNNSNG